MQQTQTENFISILRAYDQLGARLVRTEDLAEGAGLDPNYLRRVLRWMETQGYAKSKQDFRRTSRGDLQWEVLVQLVPTKRGRRTK